MCWIPGFPGSTASPSMFFSTSSWRLPPECRWFSPEKRFLLVRRTCKGLPIDGSSGRWDVPFAWPELLLDTDSTGSAFRFMIHFSRIPCCGARGTIPSAFQRREVLVIGITFRRHNRVYDRRKPHCACATYLEKPVPIDSHGGPLLCARTYRSGVADDDRRHEVRSSVVINRSKRWPSRTTSELWIWHQWDSASLLDQWYFCCDASRQQ